MKLRTSILIGLLVLSIAPLVISIAAYLPSTLSTLKTSAEAQATASSRTEAANLARRLDYLRTSLLRLSELSSSWELATLSDRKRRQTAKHLADATQHWLSRNPEVVDLVLVAPDGRELLRILPIAEPDGVHFVIADPTSESSWFPGEQFAVDELATDMVKLMDSGRESSFLIGAPVIDRRGDQAATLALEVELPVLARDVLDLYWVGAGGDLLLRPASSVVALGPNAYVSFAGISGQMDQAKEFTWTNDHASVSWTPLQLDGGSGSTTWVGSPVDYSGIERWLKWYSLSMSLIALTALMLAILLSWMLSRRIISFSRQVVTGFRRMFHSGERVSFDARAGRELNDVASDLNVLANTYLQQRAEQKLTETRLRDQSDEQQTRLGKVAKAERHSQALLKAVGNPMLFVDIDDKVRSCNDPCLKLLGLNQAGALIGQPIGNLLQPAAESQQQPDRLVQVTGGDDAAHGEQANLRTSDDRIVAAEWWSRPVHENGKRTGTVIMFRDLREALATEQEQASKRKELQLSLDAIGEGVVTTNASGQIRYLNPAGARMLGWSAEEARGEPLTMVLPMIAGLAGEAANDQPARDNMPPGIDNERESLMTARSGQRLYLEHNLAPIHDESGDLLGNVVVFRDITGSPRMSHQPDYRETHDVLTGLVNRVDFEARLDTAVSECLDPKCKHVLCYLDLDRFRAFNDSCGQAAGDALLRQIASLLKAKVRQCDTVARVGGDDYAILLKSCPMDQALRIATKLRQLIQDFSFGWEGESYRLTTSVGITPISAAGQSASALLSAAEATCYIAKTVGGNRVKVHRPDDQELRQYSQTHWVSRINQALEENGFRLFYQPVMPVPGRPGRDGTQHYELLLRMVDESGSFTNAGSFLPFAERYNMIQMTDRWVVRTAFEWLASGGFKSGDLVIGINISEPTLSDPAFADYIKEQLNSTEAPADCISFQIAARAAHAKPHLVSGLIDTLRGMGFRTAIDNLGAGQWSLDQLSSLHVDYLKIDGDYIKGMSDSRLNATVIKSITEIARELGRKTIAKSVENDETLEALAAIGVDYAQGYGIARPRPLEFLKKTR